MDFKRVREGSWALVFAVWQDFFDGGVTPFDAR
jgi:hypothetical protein